MAILLQFHFELGDSAIRPGAIVLLWKRKQATLSGGGQFGADSDRLRTAVAYVVRAENTKRTKRTY
jgi:hypothetical protein